MKPRKRFGQNFLTNQQIIDDIIALIQPCLEDNLIEIGPGQGALTDPLLRAAKKLHVVELDRDLISPLKAQCALTGELTVHQADALKFDFAALLTDHPGRLVGNLPYNISSQLLFHLLRYQERITDMHFMLQKEVVDRMAAGPNSKAYGRLSVMIQVHCRVEPLLFVPPSAFYPAPKVDSMIVRLTPYRPARYPDVPLETLDKIVRLAFQQRRKTLRNSLGAVCDEAALLACDIDPRHRAENLSVAQYCALAQHLTP